MNAIANVLVAPLTATDIVAIIGALGGCAVGIIYAWKGIKPQDQTVNRLGNAIVNLQDNQTKMALYTQVPTPLKPNVSVFPPKPPEVKP